MCNGIVAILIFAGCKLHTLKRLKHALMPAVYLLPCFQFVSVEYNYITKTY